MQPIELFVVAATVFLVVFGVHAVAQRGRS